jgi:dTDP-4-dehydrorhamnose reductase
MKVLVTGREGQLARCLAERAAGRSDLQLIAVGRPELDLEDAGSIRRTLIAHQPDLVINAAAYTAVDQAEEEPDRAFRINGAAAGELAAATRSVGARLVHISTDYVFDGEAAHPYDEKSPVNPLSVYGRSKLEGEELVRANNPEHVIVRTAWVYSPFGKNFLKTMVRLAEDRDEVGVVDDQHGNPSSALDLADGLLAIVRAWEPDDNRGVGETYHLTGNGETTWCGFARRIFIEAERNALPFAATRPIRTEDFPTRAIRPRNSRLSSAKFEGDFGYRAPGWQEATAAVVARLAASRST